MRNRIALAVSSVVMVLAVAGAQPGQAQSTAKSAAVKKSAAASECLSKPNGASPKGSHWYYRIDRQTRRRCWYLGALKSAGNAARAERPAERTTSKRRATPASIPAPPSSVQEIPAAEPMPVEAPAVTTAANDRAFALAAADAYRGVPMAADTLQPRERDAALVAGRSAETAETDDASMQEPQPEMPPVWPALATTGTGAAQIAAAQTSEPAPGFGHLLLFLLTAAAFVAVAIHTALKLRLFLFGHRRRQPSAKPDAVRALMPVQLAAAPPIQAPSIQASPEPDGIPAFLTAPRPEIDVDEILRLEPSERQLYAEDELEQLLIPRRRAVA